MTTLPTRTPDTTTEMVNENQNMFHSGNINNQHLNDENEPKLIEVSSVTVTKELFLCRICYNYDQIERFVECIRAC